MEVGTDSTPSLTFPDCLNQLATGRRANRRTVPAKAPSLATLCGRGNKWDGVESVPTNDGLFADQLCIMFRRQRRTHQFEIKTLPMKGSGAAIWVASFCSMWCRRIDGSGMSRRSCGILTRSDLLALFRAGAKFVLYFWSPRIRFYRDEPRFV